MQSKGEILNDLIVFAIFIYLILLINGKVQLPKATQEKLNNLLYKRGTLIKILVYAGAVLFLLLIILNLVSSSH
jgi:hypothetical protein